MDIKAELNNFKPINLEAVAQQGDKLSDNIRNSIFMYNKAIESLRNGSEDIAVIELRKAVSMNPNFNEALNLLGICYSYIGEKEKAAETFARVISSEPNSVYALNFMQRSGIGEVMPSAIKAKQQKKQQQDQPAEPLKRIRKRKPEKPEKPEKTVNPLIFDTNRKRRMLISAAKIGAGFIVGVLLSFIIIYPSVGKPQAVVPTPQQDNTQDLIDQATAELGNKIAELEKKYEASQKDRENAIKQADYYKAAIRLYEIEAMAGRKEYESAADMLLLMKTVEFQNDEKEKFDSLYEKVMPLAAKSAYDTGYKLYNQKKYQESLKSFDKVRMYDPKYSKMDAALYYMGRCNQILQDSRSALALYQELVAGYPESWYTRNAKVRINELTKIP
jgi:tetratricopeptide (TPR) repeat protein